MQKLLSRSAFEPIAPLSAYFPGCEATLHFIQHGEDGSVWINEQATAACIETFYGFHYFGGAFDADFLDGAAAHILHDIIPRQALHPFVTERLGFGLLATCEAFVAKAVAK